MSDELHDGVDHSTYVPTTEELLLMFSGNANHTVVSDRYKAEAEANKAAASFIAAVTEQNDREAKRLAGLEKARAAKADKRNKRKESRESGSIETEDSETIA